MEPPPPSPPHDSASSSSSSTSASAPLHDSSSSTPSSASASTITSTSTSVSASASTSTSASASASTSDPLVPVPMENPLPPPVSLEELMYYQDWNQEMDMLANALQEDANAPPQVQGDANANAPQLQLYAQLLLGSILEALQHLHQNVNLLGDIELEDILAQVGIVEGHPLWDLWRPLSEAHRALRAAVPAVVESLPTITVDATFLVENELTKDSVCAVCRGSFKEGHLVKKLGCSHCYHVPCILPWLSFKNTCPVCREPLPREVQP